MRFRHGTLLPTPFRRVADTALLALALVLLPSLSMAQNEVKLSELQARNIGVRVAHPVSSRTDQTLPYPAQIVIPTPQLWVVSAPVAGMVTNLWVARGDRIAAGQQLVTLQSPSFVSQQREYLHAVAQEVLATQQLKRNTDLFEGKAVPQRVLETSQVEARQASIAVSPGQRLEQSAPLVKLARLSPVWAEIAVPASSIRAIRTGAKVEVEGYAAPGKVVLVSETTDAATQTILVRAEIPNDGDLHPGQTAAVRIGFLSAGDSAWEIPYGGLVRRGEQTSVFVAIDGGFRLVPVTLVAEDQDHVVVSGPISDKDEVAIGGISALRGMLSGLGQ